MKYISNAFSLQMLDCSLTNKLLVRETTKDHFDRIKKDAYSCVGHPDTAKLLGVSFNRESIELKQGDKLFVAQLIGGRLPEGATELPEGFEFKYLIVEVK